QVKIGALVFHKYREQLMARRHDFQQFSAHWLLPNDERRQGIILYLHGGGYCCGGLDYAKGFGGLLAVKTGTRVFAPAYRLAPEHPFPAALEDALESYQYLLNKGYTPDNIVLAGESAGGGLCYVLCEKLKEMGQPLPSGIIAMSPWTDLTSSGPSYTEKKHIDPTLTMEVVNKFADAYTSNRLDPLVSPVFADLSQLPPSIIFVGTDEILLSDAELIHEKLRSHGCKSKLYVKEHRWHGYIFYDLPEDEDDITRINQFLNKHLSPEQKLRWMPLDNAAKIYPAAQSNSWSNVYRISATLTEPVDKDILQNALDITVRRFPSIGAKLRRGFFWYYLEQLDAAPKIQDENPHPLKRMSREETRSCALRVIVHDRRIAIECFHVLSDGTGAMSFLKSLLAEYLQQKHSIVVSTEHGVLDRLEEPRPEELEDSFQKYAAPVSASRRATTAWKFSGTREPDHFLHLTCFQLPVDQVLQTAKEHGLTLTAFLAAAMMQALQNLQKEKVPVRSRRKAIKVLLPVNLRSLFPSKTLRNFALYTTPEINPKLGDYTFDEIGKAVKHCMGAEVNPKFMSTMIATNVKSEQNVFLKLVPLFLKNKAMKMVYDIVGERKSCLSMSNLGNIKLPEEMTPYVERFDVILGVQSIGVNNCGIVSFDGTLYVNMIRSVKESDLEYHFYKVLESFQLPVLVESNNGDRPVN
ncbi:MAG: alpha/beta hydrolase fold domain-containing protein, partial [Firmicutes bacterium]|nr:alpha/beta hydrolase fold domain-containing protein [Bacillota bacterium]